jgi:hypothetical protein
MLADEDFGVQASGIYTLEHCGSESSLAITREVVERRKKFSEGKIDILRDNVVESLARYEQRLAREKKAALMNGPVSSGKTSGGAAEAEQKPVYSGRAVTFPRVSSIAGWLFFSLGASGLLWLLLKKKRA